MEHAERQIVHVDMDAFFASVEQRDRPALRGKPVLVGGRNRRGVVAAASYEAREFGVASAMPMVEALRRCPEAIVVSPTMGRYGEVSKEVFAIFRRYTPVVEGLSVDEAFLDVTRSRLLFGDGTSIAKGILQEIEAELSLTASAGVSSSKFVSKVASALKKPNGLVTVARGTEAEFLAPLPIRRMWGVGPKSAERLRRHGIYTLGTLAGLDVRQAAELLGSHGPRICALARGEDVRAVTPHSQRKSLSAEQTFEHDLKARADVERALLAQSTRVAQRLTQEGGSASTVIVKLKYADFTQKTRQKSLSAPVSDTDSIYRAARALLDSFEGRRLGVEGVRLVGVGVSDFDKELSLPGLFDDQASAQRKRVEETVGALREKFGAEQVTRATLLTRKS